MIRYSIHGDVLTGSVFTTECGECGMPLLDAMEFHPWEACEAFKRTHDSRIVIAEIEPLFRERILRPAAAGEAAE